jgi:arabinose-5-phosphate isomerase
MMETLIERSRKYLDYFYLNIEPASWNQALDICLKTKGHIYFTGIGKSGFIAQKIAMTLVSLGTRSLFLDPLNVLHGDLGVVEEGDVVIIMSKSGFTKELLDIVPHLKKRKARLIACVSSKNSPLEQICDQGVYLPVEGELDDNHLVPTTSTEVQLIFGNILSTAIMNSKGVDLQLYAALHPAGSIGKKLLTKVEELMLIEAQIPFCYPDSAIKDVLFELTSKKCGCVLVTDKNRALYGIFTDGDLRRSLQNIGTEALNMPVSKLMSSQPTFIDKDKTAFEAKKTMQQDAKTWVNVLPIVENNQVIGLVRLHDILKAGI